MKKNKSWFKLKHYPHIGLPISPSQRPDVEKFIHNKDKISHFAFLPLIRKEQRTYRYKISEGNKLRRRLKPRPISYASHFDSLIYSYYAQRLSKCYEEFLASNNLCENVIAYRSVPKGNKGNKCNIDFAKETFDFISKAALEKPISVIVTDISSFFDNINHSLLKKAWGFICKEERLDNAEYNIFKHVTRFSYVNDRELFELFKNQMICSKEGSGVTQRRSIKNMKYFRHKNVIAFCEKKDISLIRSRGLIRTNKPNEEGEVVGIPQGLPISAVLANMYMYQFDSELSSFISLNGGLYRRYSDDVMIVCPRVEKQRCIDKLKELIKDVKLTISDDKTKVFDVEKNENATLEVKHQDRKAFIEYLGFSYDGKSIRIKNKGISHYYLKMSKSVRRKLGYALHKNDRTYGYLFVNQLLRRFTPIGSRRHKILRMQKGTRKFKYNGERSFGNFWSYVVKSASICESDAILHQLKRNKPILSKHIRNANEEIRRCVAKRQISEYMRYGKTYTSVKKSKN